MSKLKELRPTLSDQMTINLPRGNEVDPRQHYPRATDYHVDGR